MQLPCEGESEKESRQAGNEIAAVSVDLDSADDDGTAPEEEELLGKEEQPIAVRPVMPFGGLDLCLFQIR
jgi:hypothetical protein